MYLKSFFFAFRDHSSTPKNICFIKVMIGMSATVYMALPRCKNPQLTSLPISHNTINTNVAYRAAYLVIGSMDRWFDGSKVCWFDGCVESSIDRWFDGSLVRWIVGSMDAWKVRWIVGSMDRWIDGSLVRWIVGSMDCWSMVRWFDGLLVRWIVGSMVRWFDE